MRWIAIFILGAALLLACGDDDESTEGLDASPTATTPAADDGDGGDTASPSPTSTPTATPTAGTDDAAPADLAEWATGVCAAIQSFEVGIVAGLEPEATDLSVQERIDRANRTVERWEPVFEDSIELLQALEPPPETTELTEALIQQLESVRDAIESAVADVQDATTQDEIDAADAEISAALTSTEGDVVAAASRLTPEAIAALQEPAECGSFRGS